MKKCVLIFVTMLAFSAISFAQNDAKTFTGTWNLDVEKSELGERSRLKSMTMTVTQTETELSYDRKVERDQPDESLGGGGRRGMRRGMGGPTLAQTFDLSGKETPSPVSGRGAAVLKAERIDDALKLTQTRSFEGRMGSVTVTTTEKWSLSEDGNTLTVMSDSQTPRGNRSSKMIFTLNKE